MDTKSRFQIEDICFRNGVVQLDLDKIFKLISQSTKMELLLFDKWCESSKIEDIKLTSIQFVDKYLKECTQKKN